MIIGRRDDLRDLQPNRSAGMLLAATSLGLAILAVLSDAPGSGFELVFHLCAIAAIVGWATLVRYPAWLMALIVGGSVIGLGWAGGTPDGVVFQSVLAGGVVGYAISSLRLSIPLTLLLSLASLAGVLLPGDTDWGSWNWFGGTWILWIAGWLLGRLESTVVALEATRHELVEAEVRAGRQLMAREVHDIVGHSLTAVLLHVEAAHQALGTDEAMADDSLRLAATAGRAGMRELRSSVAVLQDGTGDARLALPDGRDLRALLDRQTEAAVRTAGPVDELAGSVAVAAYRVTQEALTNAVRHGGGGDVEVEVSVTDDAVSVRVENAWPQGGGAGHHEAGQHQAGQHGVGISGMSERVRQLGGELVAGPADGRWVLRAVIPRP